MGIENSENQKSTTTWHYYDSDGQKQGPISGGRLKRLAKTGRITPETMIETENGKVVPAVKIQGLTFSETAETLPNAETETEHISVESVEILPSADNPFLYPPALLPNIPVLSFGATPIQASEPMPEPVPQVKATRWLKTDERNDPSGFCATIGFTINFAHFVFVAIGYTSPHDKIHNSRRHNRNNHHTGKKRTGKNHRTHRLLHRRNRRVARRKRGHHQGTHQKRNTPHHPHRQAGHRLRPVAPGICGRQNRNNR